MGTHKAGGKRKRKSLGWTHKKKTSTTTTTATQPPIPPTLRGKQSQGISMGTDISLFQIGYFNDILGIHTNLLPPPTRAHFARLLPPYQPVLRLPEEDPAIFDIYRHWLYTGKLYTMERENDTDGDAEWTMLAHCYFLGRGVFDERFCNAAVDALLEKVAESEEHPTGCAGDVYRFTEHGDALRRLYVDLHVWMGEGENARKPHHDANGPKTFKRDVRKLLAEVQPKLESNVLPPWEDDVCGNYHSHAHSERCVGWKGGASARKNGGRW